MISIMKSLPALGFSLMLLNPAHASEAGRIDIQRVLPNGQLTREIPVGEPVTLRVSGIWHNACLPAVVGFEPSGNGRLLNLFWNSAAFIGCGQALTPFSRHIENVRFDEGEIGVLPVAVVYTQFAVPFGSGSAIVVDGMRVLPEVEIAVQAPPEKQIAHWPTARRPPAGLYALTPIYDIGGSWYAPESLGSGLLLSHARRQAGSSTQDVLFGSWANFSIEGKSQWHLFADTYWASPTRLLGKIFRAEDDQRGCTRQFPNPKCIFEARSAKRLDTVGIFELDIQNPDELVMTIDDSGRTLLLGLVQPPVEGYRVRLRRQ